MGISSNNIVWTRTKAHLRMIYVPYPFCEKYIALINPEVKEMSKMTFESVEGCAAFPKKGFNVRRHSYVRVRGTAIKNYGFRHVELEYRTEGKANSSENRKIAEKARVVQHELDHLEGILVKDRAFSSFDIDD